MSSPYQPVLNPADLEPTASDPIVGRYAQDLAVALQKAASLGLGLQLPPRELMPGGILRRRENP